MYQHDLYSFQINSHLPYTLSQYFQNYDNFFIPQTILCFSAFLKESYWYIIMLSLLSKPEGKPQAFRAKSLVNYTECTLVCENLKKYLYDKG